MRRALVLAALVAASAAADAQAAVTDNACRWTTIDNLWRTQSVDLAAAPAPNPVGPGGSVSLNALTMRATLPEFISEVGYNTGLLRAGRNDIPFQVWVAVTAGGEPQVLNAAGTTATTVTVDDRELFRSATPMDVSVALPASTWPAPSAGALAFAQAAPGVLPRLPVGPRGAVVQPAGSIVAQATMPPDNDPSTPDLRVTLDCQPGTGSADEKSMTPGTATAIATVPVQDGAPLVDDPYAVPEPEAAVRIRGASGTVVKRKRKRARVRMALRLACTAGTGACFGKATVRTAKALQFGGRFAKQVLGRSEFSIGAGGRRKLAVKLTKAGRTLLRRKAKLRVTVTAGAATRTLTLKTTTRRKR